MPFVCYKKVLYLQLLNSVSVCVFNKCNVHTNRRLSVFPIFLTQLLRLTVCRLTGITSPDWCLNPPPAPPPIQYVRTSFPSSFASSAGKKNISLRQGKPSLRWTRWRRQNNLWIYGGKSWMIISVSPPCMTTQSSESHGTKGVNVKPLKGNWYWIG